MEVAGASGRVARFRHKGVLNWGGGWGDGHDPGAQPLCCIQTNSDSECLGKHGCKQNKVDLIGRARTSTMAAMEQDGDATFDLEVIREVCCIFGPVC